MPSSDDGWARAYARQALSDLGAREALVRSGAEKCHRLHFLQMAAEKACKAHLVMAHGHEQVRKRHDCVEKTLPVIARNIYSKIYAGTKMPAWEIDRIRELAREIELLAPACDDGDARRDNSEYPWEGPGGEVLTPCDYSFSSIDDGSRAIIRLIKLLQEAAESYSN